MALSTYDYNRRRRKKKKNWAYEIITAILVVLTICCGYAGAVDPQSFFGAPFMVLAFIPMLILLLVFFVIALIKRRWLAALAVVFGFVATAPIIKMFVPLNTVDTAPPMPADTRLILNVMTYNALSFNYNEADLNAKPSESMRMILDANPDVVLLQEGGAVGVEWQEIPSIKPFMDEINKKYPYCYQSAEGLNIMSKYPFTTQAVGESQHLRTVLGYNRSQSSHVARIYDLQLPNGNQLRLVDFRLQSYHLSFGKNMNVRVSPDVKPSALERMRRSFALRADNAAVLRKAIDESPANVIMCGDMNDVPTSYVYRVIKGDDLNDAWAEVGRGYAHTFNRHHLPFRIDHILYRGDLRALSAKRLTGGSSDHYPLMVSFDIEKTK